MEKDELETIKTQSTNLKDISKKGFEKLLSYLEISESSKNIMRARWKLENKITNK